MKLNKYEIKYRVNEFIMWVTFASVSFLILWAFGQLFCSGIIHAEIIQCTAYSPDEPDSRPFHGKNALGFSVLQKVEGYGQCAADPDWLPSGSLIYIPRLERTVIVCDVGSGVQGHHLDIACEDMDAMNDFPTGRYHIEIRRIGWHKTLSIGETQGSQASGAGERVDAFSEDCSLGAQFNLSSGVESRHALTKPASETRSVQVIKEQSPKLEENAPLIVERRSPSRSRARPTQFTLVYNSKHSPFRRHYLMVAQD